MNTERIGNKAPDWGRRDFEVEALWTEIVPGLWVGGTHDDDTMARGRGYTIDSQGRRRGVVDNAEITKNEFDAVITLYAWARPVDWHVEELRTGIMDGIPTPEELELVMEAVAWGYKRWTSGRKVLVRCQAGMNRSSLVAALILMENGMRAGEAIQAIRTQRSRHCLFNEEFVRVLINEQARKNAEEVA